MIYAILTRWANCQSLAPSGACQRLIWTFLAATLMLVLGLSHYTLADAQGTLVWGAPVPDGNTTEGQYCQLKNTSNPYWGSPGSAPLLCAPYATYSAQWLAWDWTILGPEGFTSITNLSPGTCAYAPTSLPDTCYFTFTENRPSGPINTHSLMNAYYGGYWVSTDEPAQSEISSTSYVGDPANPAIGNTYFTKNDVRVGSIAFQRFYNSADLSGLYGMSGWRHSFSRSIATIYQSAGTNYPGASASVSSLYSTASLACTSGFPTIQAAVPAWTNATVAYINGVCVISNSGVVIGTLPLHQNFAPTPPTTAIEYDVIRDNGQTLRYTLQNGIINNPIGVSLRLAVTGSGFTVTDDQDNIETYNAAGALQSVQWRGGLVQTMSYSGGLLGGVSDSFGNAITVNRNTDGTISNISVNNGGMVQYAYTNGDSWLSTVTHLDGNTEGYTYYSTIPNGTPLHTIVDENQQIYSTWSYDSQGRVTSSQQALGANAMTIVSYNSDGSTAATDALGTTRTFSYSRLGDVKRITTISGSRCPGCQDAAITTYDSGGWVSSRADYNGNLTCYANDQNRGLELVRVEGFASGSTCPANLSSYTPVIGTLQRKITTTWNTTWREPAEIDEPNRTTTFAYYSTGMLQTKTVKDLTVTPNVTRAWNYTYTSYGQPLTIKGPRGNGFTDLTTIAYYPCPGTYCGQIETIQNQVGQITTFNTYDAYGKPLTITDPNHVVTTLIYDSGERLHSRQVGSETTIYTYWPTGLLETVQLPDSSTFTYSYDSAHRLHQITDTAGNYVVYSYDLMSNRTGEETFDSSGVPHRNHTRQFNALSQLWKDINSANTSAVTTTYLYDSQGNQTNVNAPLSRNTTKYYDALNRVKQINDPNNGNTYLGYDANDNLASVEDPRTFTTSYSHNGFNDLTQVVSPDTGTTLYNYDSGGNPKTITDARNAAANLSFDDANRLTKVVYSDQTINYGYDSGTNGVGRLTSASDANHSMSWAYDTLGRVSGKGQTVASVTKSVGYSYTNGDLITLVTPSNQTITYGYTNHRITSIQVGSTTLLNGVTYDPFGPATGWTWGNGTTTSKSFDMDGNPGQIVTAGVTNIYAVDDASRITQLTDGGLSSNTWNFTAYDAMDRIKTASSSAKSRGYTYDANGNVQSIAGSTASTETVSTTNNHLNATSGGIVRTYSYDAAGNASYTGEAFTFNQRGRMSVAVSSAGTTNYVYNALGQLIEKSGNGGTTLLVYDEAGHILGEYTSAGALVQETVWMGDTPVATLRPNGTGISIYYVHTDHLGTPRKVTRPSDNGLMWRYDPDTYGASTTAANSNPAGLGTFVYNLRFSGQYFLAESGLSYNHFRTYDPAVGRYIEADPIGLAGGINPYAYVGGNPINKADFLGLYASIVQIGNNLQIQIPISYTGASPDQIQAWNRAIETTWTGQIGQYNVTTIVTNPDPAAAPNQINTVNVISGPVNANPAAWVNDGNAGTFIGSAVDATPAIAAHEAGHFMGLPDDYSSSIDQFGNRVTVPLPGYKNDIMATLSGLPSPEDMQTIANGPSGLSIPAGKNPGECP